MRIFLVKPYQPCTNFMCSPPMGLLSLISTLRQRLGSRIEIRYLDAKLTRRSAQDMRDDLAWADVVGISALNFEAQVAADIAALAKTLDPGKTVVLGGPYAHHREVEILTQEPNVDWVFGGESDYTFPEAIATLVEGRPLTGAIKGMHYRDPVSGTIVNPPGNDFITDLDALPYPAWDLIDFDHYAREQNMNFWLEGTRYAMLFTSRGCPYKCSYCHDLFTKKFRMQSAERVLAEIDYLVTTYKVDEFQIIDDIFNLHKPRVKAIFGGVVERYGKGKLHFCFANGLRGDILDREIIRVLAEGGAYQISVAVETVTPRLQTLIQKNLDIPKVASFIDFCHAEGIVVRGFFMLGFPTETREELWNTIKFAWRSKLTFAGFFTVVPQPGTPLYELAKKENAAALEQLSETGYYSKRSWYSMAYGYPVNLVSRFAYLVFFFHPGRLYRMVKRVPPRSLLRGFRSLLAILISVDLDAVVRRARGWFRPATPEITPTPQASSDSTGVST